MKLFLKQGMGPRTILQVIGDEGSCYPFSQCSNSYLTVPHGP